MTSERRRLRAILYARVSTGDREAGPDGQKVRRQQDPEAQLLRLRSYAAQRGWPVVAEFSDVITCDPVRRRKDPPGFVRAMRMLQERKGDVLVIVGAHRLVAGALALLNLVSRVQELGGAIASMEDGRDLDTTDEMSLLSLFMKGIFNTWRLKLGREATIRGLERARAQGKILGRPPVQGPTLAEVQAAEAAAGRRLTHRELAEHFKTTTWAIRAVKNPGLKKGAGSDDPGSAEGGL